MQLTRENNFNIIRLLASLQVVFVHSTKHLNLFNDSSEPFSYFIKEFIGRFPGVPIFFVVSGFLVYWSLERNKDNLKKFFKNRLLRIYPGLWFCLIVTIILLIVFKSLTWDEVSSPSFFYWLFGQLTFFQFYTPEILRDFGVGTPNGSLWTITVELQYYLILPLLFLLVSRFKKRMHQNLSIFAIILFSLVFAYVIKLNFDEETMVNKLGRVNVLMYLYNFVFGILMYVNWKYIKKYLVNKAIYWLVIYVVYILVFYFLTGTYGKGYVPNFFGIIAFLLLSILTISFAYSKPNLSKYLKGYDISYGVYIYHMLVINALIELKYDGKISFILSFIFSIILGYISWVLVEKKALSLKNKIRLKTK